MHQDSRLLRLSGSALAALLFVSACGDGTGEKNDTATNEDGEAPLAASDELFGDVPPEAELPSAGKPDAVYPAKFSDLVKTQSAVKSQGSRGVCSIFATAALMEHLYLKEDASKTWDFSEQYLQWAVKTQVRAFTDTEGSNSSYNLQAIHEYGIVEEPLWKYESAPWGTTNDAACTGDKRPVRCYTNGEPPAGARDGKKWHLPAGRWISAKAHSIKGHMVGKKSAVVVGAKFFYQSWNHRMAKLPTSNEYWREGYVLSPNADDKKQTPAGHAFLLVGWDDELSVQKRDKDGKGVVDASGKPVMEKGFFLFKNSWGTGSFGVNNPHGAGFGWISYKYIEEFGTAYVSDVPGLAAPGEICDDGRDNDRDSKIDCEDSNCSGETICQGGTSVYENTTATPIPDNTTSGVTSSIDVPDSGLIESLSVTVDITHSYRGDLSLKLTKGTKTVTLLSADGSDDKDLRRTFRVSGFNGKEARGLWKLNVRDEARGDTGTLNSWSLEIAR